MSSCSYLKAALGFVCALALAFVLIAVFIAPTFLVHAAGEGFIVDNTGDDPYKYQCTEAANDCSLRGAIMSANSTTDVTIHFGVDHVDLDSALPPIIGARTWIDGTTVLPRINAYGASSGNVFTIRADDVTLSNLVVYNTPSGGAEVYIHEGRDAGIAYNYLGVLPETTNCSSLESRGGNGVLIDTTAGSSGTNNGAAYIYGNVIGCHTNKGIYVGGSEYVYIGVQRNGYGDGNWIGLNKYDNLLPNNSHGIYLQGLSLSQAMTATISNNLISGNDGSGINISSSSRNEISKNIIGTNNSITSAMPNDGYGVHIDGPNSSENKIVANKISGNGRSGVYLSAPYNYIEGNSIGVNIGNTAAISNGEHGVEISGSAAMSNTVGGATALEANLISGNYYSGVFISYGAQYNSVLGNWIGLDGSGAAAIPNGNAGVAIVYANNNYIGAYSGAYNYISGNTIEGIYLQGVDGYRIRTKNRIGVATDGVTPLGNGEQGVMINGSSNGIVWPELIAYNGKAGVAVITSAGSATGNDIAPYDKNFGNGGLPIDLGNDGATPNGTQSPPGPNNWIEYPEVSLIDGRVIYGKTCPNCRVYFYIAVGNPAASGGGGSNVGYITADSSGDWSIDLDTLPGGTSLTRASITMMACDTSHNCSEMSPRPVAYLPLLRK